MAGLNLQLLQAFCRGASQREVLGFLGQISDWDNFCNAAAPLRLLPLFYRRLLARGLLEHVGSSCREKLKAAYYRNLGHNIACASLTTRVLEVLDSEKIDAVLLKGIAHVYDCYEDAGERVIGDIDLLVKTDELEWASSLLSRAGFAKADIAETPAQHHHLPPFTDGAGLNFELHHTLAPLLAPVQIDPHQLWDRVRPSSAFKRAFLLDPIDSLIHTSIHLWISSDLTGQVYQLIDIDRLVRTHFSREDDWKVLQLRAARFATVTPVFRTLSFAVELLGTPVPAHIREALRLDSSGWKGLLPIARVTIAGRGGTPQWLHEICRDILSYRKIALLKPPGLDRIWYLFTRPGALILDLVRILLAPIRRG
jgi:hypothetical protein